MKHHTPPHTTGANAAMFHIPLLVVGVPTLLMVLMLVLGRIEESLVRPGERAAALAELIASTDDPDTVEQAAQQLCADAAPPASRDHEQTTRTTRTTATAATAA